ncbi:MAG: hypothetical protein HQ557_18250 [Bacteroidetes bacterium]|nr:hypothetical protein [Bacteroidota bacterium]
MQKSNLRIIAGLLIIPTFLLQKNLILMAVQVAFVMVLAVLKGRKIKPVPVLVVLISVVLMNLLQVNGKVLFTVGSFSVTLGALKIGLDKALTLIGMLYVSQYMVSGKPKLPGKFGQLLSKQFLFFEYIVTSWKRPERGKFIESLDTVLETMEHIYPEADKSNGTTQALKAGSLEVVTESVFVLFMWASFIVGFLGILPW